ncbi:MAG: metallophosphatase family protein [Deltaproteobacteria bacterium]|nr:metallophosphatase family protein [Deltaproteobacteria bacterium]
MRIAVIADIHGNLEALSAVIADLKESLPDVVISLGDVVGYGADPQECCDIVREAAQRNIMGNHDAAAAGVLDTAFFNDDAREAIQWTRGQISEPAVSWLRSSSYTFGYEDMLFSHGSPVNPEEFDYVMTIGNVEKAFYAFGAKYKIFFVGHSHRRFTVSQKMQGDEAPVVDCSDTVAVEEQRRYIISVGSVGQPRDRDSTASYGILDTDRRLYTVKRLRYAIKTARDKIIKAGLPRWLADRLMMGV